MDITTFERLTYGNIISEAGRKLMVQHTLKDANGFTYAVGVIEAIEVKDASGLRLEVGDSSRTVIASASDGKLVLKGETIPAPL